MENRYFDFEQTGGIYDVALCLNVLHHLGDDFGDQALNIDQAKKTIVKMLQNLSKRVHTCWFQLGFNWKGDRNFPLFAQGLKSEMIDFIQRACSDFWLIEEVAIYDPIHCLYKRESTLLLQRSDDIGEFLNRPIFLLTSERAKND